MNNIFRKIYQSQCLTQKESYNLFKLISSEKIDDIQISSILTAMKIRGESIEEVLGAIEYFLKKMKHFPRPKYIFSDIVGTGGDKKNTINLSTASAFVASACGFKIIKHCNQGVSRHSGSSDILNRFDINLNASSQTWKLILNNLNICFLFAQNYHNGFKYAGNVRKILKTKTIFNLLGPFLNPAQPSFIVIGVYSKKLINFFIKILKKLKYQRAIVLHSHDTDEVTLHDNTYVSELKNGKIFSYELEPKNFGLKIHSNTIFREKSIDQNYNIIKNTMQGKGREIYEELIAVNVAILLKIFGQEDLKKNTQVALNKIRSGDVYKHILNISNMSKED